ncbi:MAG TPA: GNAT family N-acetyltransferase [Polyangia bacterium]|nr:GNAT family N-acetyltransferase [Polyangia bacterium]
MNPAAAPAGDRAAATPPALRLTWARALAREDGEQYDAFVSSAASGHYAQARFFAPVARAGRPFASSFVLLRDGDGRVAGAAHVLRATVAGLPLPYAIVERGPVVKDAALLGPILTAVARAARRRGIARLLVMPYWTEPVGAPAPARAALRVLGWTCVQAPASAHANTLRVRVAGKAEADIFAGGANLHLRQKIKLAQREGATARRGTAADLPVLARLHDALMARQGKRGKPPRFYAALAALDLGGGPGENAGRGDAGLFLTEHGGRPIAAVLAVRHGALVTYAMGATIDEPCRFSKTVPAVVAAIRWARDAGCDFDLGGVPTPGDTDPKRLAIAQFKREFARTEIPLCGQHARWLV